MLALNVAGERAGVSLWLWVSMGERVGGLWRVDDFDFGFGFVRGLACVMGWLALDWGCWL